MFVGRARELKTLSKQYESGDFSFVVVYGRRRVGKTTLLNRFSAGKPTFRMLCLEDSPSANLGAFSRSLALLEREISPATSDPAASSAVVSRAGAQSAYPAYPDFQSALDRLFELGRDRRIVAVFDEYPYLSEAVPSFDSMLQHAVDRAAEESSGVMLVLCGSSVSYMERDVLGKHSPLHGRNTALVKVEPLPFAETRLLHPDCEPVWQAEAYGALGGTALYHRKFSDGLTIRENIEQNLLDPDCFLFSEPDTVMNRARLRSQGSYRGVLSAMAAGASKQNEISQAAGVEYGRCGQMLQVLEDQRLVRRDMPFGEGASSRQGSWSVADPFLRLWYASVPPFVSMIDAGRVGPALDWTCERLQGFMGSAFEQICAQWLWADGYERIPFDLREQGRWWHDGGSGRQAEIDIVGKGVDQNDMLFCECKWRNEDVGVGVLDGLVEKSHALKPRRPYYLVFSKTGFTQACRDRAEALGNVGLVGFAEMAAR